ncbi:MAG: PQQ-binding-like beta-propeller repeat protein [Thermoguttaceae bacterium]|jgi:outer membrane protein assembly factor BamB
MLLPAARLLIVSVVSLLLIPAAWAQKAAAGSSSASPLRTWTDASGQHKVRATLVKVEDGAAVLRRADNDVEVRIPLEKLSKLDQTWIARHPVAGPSSAASGAAQGEWPCWLGPNHDGKSPDTGLLKEWPSAGPTLLWKVTDLGQGYSSVAVAGGAVYVTGEKDNQLWIRAFDLAGKQKWRIEHGPSCQAGGQAGSRGTPTIDGRNLYLLSGAGLLGCFDTASGQPKWTCEAKQFGGGPGQWGYAESVLIWGDMAIFKPGGQNCIVALDKRTGQKIWASHGFSAGPEYGSCLPIFRDGQKLLVTGTNEGLMCVNAANGAFLWGNPFSAHNTANCPTPAYSDGYVFWANGYGKGGICIKVARGGKASQAWTTPEMVCHHGGYVIDHGCIYGNHDNGWACLDLKTGRKMWQDKGVGKGSLCWADGMLYLLSEQSGHAALATCSPQGLRITGRVKVEGEGPSWAHPVVIGGRLYLRYDKNLYCFDVKG